ncbi:hypothetical protein ACFOY2_46115 [Nonomuraea purpurea]|uniref:Uncharacterized protein n=1 Tax=Nonomuraea purpurea TaxID=1849276 RepID=A0ABV8GR49_9ACTN
MTTEAPFVPSLLAVVLGPDSTAPTAHHIECPMYDYYLPGDWSGSVTDLSHLTMRWSNTILHPCLSKAARAYDIPAGLQHDDVRGQWTRTEVLIGYVLDTDANTNEPIASTVARVRRLVGILTSAPFDRFTAARLETTVHRLAEQIGHGDVNASYVIATLRDRPEAATW